MFTFLGSDRRTGDCIVRRKILAGFRAANRSGFVADDELFTAEEHAADPRITEWALPANVYHGAATAPGRATCSSSGTQHSAPGSASRYRNETGPDFARTTVGGAAVDSRTRNSAFRSLTSGWELSD